MRLRWKAIGWKKKALLILGLVMLALAVLPLLIPYPKGEFTEDQLSDADSRFVDIDGVRLHYKSCGEGERTFLLLHGTLTTTRSWEKVALPLSKMGRVVAYDRPAFGLSSRPMPGEWRGASPYGYEAQVELIAGLIDRLGLGKVVLVGNSMGGAIAMMAAQRHPEGIEALVLVDPVQSRHALPRGIRWLAASPQLRRIGPLLLDRGLDGFGDSLMRLSYHDPSKIDRALYADVFKVLRVKDFDRGLWELLAAARPFEDLLDPKEIAVPTLVIAGDDDRVAGIKSVRDGTKDIVALSAKIRDSRLVVIPGCGHLPQEERPEEFLRAIASFLSGLPKEGSSR